MEIAVAFLAIGLIFGVMIGRWWTDAQHARHDMKRRWDSRSNYRDK